MRTANDFLKQLEVLSGRTQWSLFEPSSQFYSMLESGEDADLVAAAKAISAHMGIPSLRLVSYEWGLLMPASVAGRIHIQTGKIQIPMFYVGKPLALGAILAHELSHQLLAIHHIWAENEQANEQLTDAASIIAGLGKLVLNGSISEITDGSGEAELLGYLDLPTRVEIYSKVANLHGISDNLRVSFLTAGAIDLLRTKGNRH